MAATVRGVHPSGRGGSIERDGLKEYSVIYKVVTNDKRDGPAIVRTAFGIPSIGDTYSVGNESDLSGVCVRKEVRQDQDCPFEWEVECFFSTDLGEKPPTQFSTPLDEPAEISFGFQERRILIPGRFNNPIGPPADGAWQAGIYAPNGDLFDPQPEATIADPVWTISKNVQSVSYPTFLALANSVNSDTFQGVSPRQLMLKPPRAVRKYHKVIGFYFTISYDIIYRFETWDIQILNQGYFYWPGGKPASVWSTTTLASVKKLASGELRLVNLTTNGDINTTATPTFTRIRFYREVPFATLNLL